MLCGRSQQHSRRRLPAGAIIVLGVWTEVDPADAYSGFAQRCPHAAVNLFEIVQTDFAQGDASLIDHDDDLEIRAVERRDSL
jgi:hypothetical protein